MLKDLICEVEEEEMVGKRHFLFSGKCVKTIHSQEKMRNFLYVDADICPPVDFLLQLKAFVENRCKDQLHSVKRMQMTKMAQIMGRTHVASLSGLKSVASSLVAESVEVILSPTFLIFV